MVSAISFGWFAEFGKTLPLFNARPNRFILTNGKHPRENFWNVYCLATNQMQDETAKDNGQTATRISHGLTRNNELVFSPTTNLQFYCFQILKLFFLYFSSFIANEAADPRGSAVELANHRAVREYRRKISSQRKGLFLTIFGCKFA